jgi:CRISPR-associated protein Csm5
MRFKLAVLTPTHIGDGDKYLPYEVYIEKNKAHVVRFENLIKQLSEKVQNPYFLREKFKTLANDVRNRGQHLTFEEICNHFKVQPKDIKFDYVISSDPPQNPIREVETFIKTLGKVYIPGSELKGAFRTAYAYHLLVNNEAYYKWFEDKLVELLEKLNRIDRENLNRREREKKRKEKIKNFANKIENYLFRSEVLSNSPTVDIFKLVHIGDSNLKEPQEVLTLKNIRLVGGSEPLQIWSECVKPNSLWSFDLKIQKEVKDYLNKLFKDLKEKDKYLEGEFQFLKIVDNFFRDFIDFELERLDRELRKPYLRESETYRKLKNVYLQLKSIPEEIKGVHNFLLRLGKHTGRYPHTILLALWKKESDLLERVLREFPSKTRWLTRKDLPLGWCYIFGRP